MPVPTAPVKLVLVPDVKHGDTVAIPVENPRPGTKLDTITVKHIRPCRTSAGANLHLNNWCISQHQPLLLINRCYSSTNGRD